jgi:DNA polymerase
MRDHGKVFESPYANKVIATIHPSAVLRTRDEESRHELYNLLKNDLASAGRIAGNPSVIPM